MSNNLAALLPPLLPRAIEWANARSNHILANGEPLDSTGLQLAAAVGVVNAAAVRVLSVAELPLPGDPDLRSVALQTGLLGPGMIGLTLGYGIYVRDGYADERLLSHECRHVYQYEIAGSIEEFLPVYLQQVVTCGYHNAPFELDARAHEIDSVP